MMAQSNKSPRVLIVDDDPLAREVLTATLQREGYTLLVAVSGVEALQKLSTLAPDLILLDVMMPLLNGFETCQQIRRQPEFRHIPIILITALEDSTEVVRGLDLGADEFITKPFNTAELKARVRSILRIKQQYDELQYMLQTRDLLAGIIVHDLRNPLAAIMLYIQLLQRKSALPPDQARFLDLVFSEAQHVSSFLDDMLLLTKLDYDQLTITPTELDLPRLLGEVRQQTTAVSESRMVDLVIIEPSSAPTGILVDMMLLPRALQHLVAHAMKSAPPASQVTLTVDTLAPSADANGSARLRICVHYPGSPIPTEELDHLFDKHALVMMHQRGKSYAGLGLAYCKLVVEAHGGTIAATNDEPEGVLFTIEL